MKKNIIAIIALSTLTIALTIYSASSFKNSIVLNRDLAAAKNTYPEIYDEIDSLTVSNFRNEVETGKKVVVYVGRPTCGDFNQFEPYLINMIRSKGLGSSIKYVNVAKLKKDKKAWQQFSKRYGIKYTPTIAEFKNGKLVDKVNWTPENGTDQKEFSMFLDQIK